MSGNQAATSELAYHLKSAIDQLHIGYASKSGTLMASGQAFLHNVNALIELYDARGDDGIHAIIVKCKQLADYVDERGLLIKPDEMHRLKSEAKDEIDRQMGC